MSVLISDLVGYCPTNMPETDGVTVGGPIDFTKRWEFFGTLLTPTLFDAVSSSTADTATQLTYYGRDSTGAVLNQTLGLNGVTKVPGNCTLERLLYGAISGGAIGPIVTVAGTRAQGDVALIAHTLTISGHTMAAASNAATSSAPPLASLQTGDGASVSPGMLLRITGGTGATQIRRILAVNPGGAGADVVALNRNFTTALDTTSTYEVGSGFLFSLTSSSQGVALTGNSTQTLAISSLFATAQADIIGGSTRIFYEEIFFNNNNLSTALQSATIAIQSITPALPGSPSGAAMDIALATALNDTATCANRQTAPSGVGSYTSGAPPQTLPVTGGSPPGTLPASTGAGNAAGAQKFIVRLTVPAGLPAFEDVPVFRIAGSST